MHNFTAGFARLDTTPPLGVPMGGSWNARLTKGVIDPMSVNAVAFGDGEKSAVLMTADLVGLYGVRGAQWAKQIEKDLQLPENSVLLCCTHTHTSPSVGVDELYDAWLYRRFRDAAMLALEDRKPVTDVRWAQDETQGMTFNRRFKLSDGTFMTNPPKSCQDMIVEPAGPADNSMRVVQILREDAKDIVLVNFQSHPDNIHGELVSPDFCGYVRTGVEALCENTCCIYINGAQGNLVISDRRDPNRPKGSAKVAKDHGMGLAKQVAQMLTKTQSTGKFDFSFGQKSVSLKTKRDPARVPECKRIVELYKADRWSEFAPSKKFANYFYTDAKKVIALEELQEDYREAPVSGVVFCGAAFIGFPGEPFCEMGMAVRENSPFTVTCAMCLTNGSLGYYPTAESFDQGGYETYATRFRKGCAEQLVDTAIDLMKTL